MRIIINSRLLLSLASIVFAAALVIGATVAFFSDTETSQDNVLVAGAIDLKIDNTSYLNGVLNAGTTWQLDDLNDQLFFDFDDIKPGDIGEDTISLHAQNDCWVCMEITLNENNDNTCTEPELLDDQTCNDTSEPGNSNLLDGELAQQINFIFWADDGDNVLEEGEEVFEEGTAQDVLDDNIIPLADANTNNLGGIDGQPMLGGNDAEDNPIVNYIGKAWCFGTLTTQPLSPDEVHTPADSTGGVACDGDLLNNATQTDRVLADIKFTAVQSRNNPGFVCQPSASPTPTPNPSPTPSPEPCGQADVMLVLDRSGSINSTEL